MPLPEFTRGTRRLLDRLLWYGGRYGHIQPSQKKLGTKLGRYGRDVSDRTVRTYLHELESYVEVQQGGDLIRDVDNVGRQLDRSFGK